METIKLDLVPGKKMPSLHASQYDDGREHGIDLFENGIAYKLDGTETLTINERKVDNNICSMDIENTFVGSSHIEFASFLQMCACAGSNFCELRISKGDVDIGTLNFILEVEPDPTADGIESESEIRNLETQIREITEEVIGDDYYTAEQTNEAIATAIEGKADTTYVNNALANKMDKANPTGTGSFSLNRKANTTVGEKSVAMGNNATASGENSMAIGNNSFASGANSVAMGNGTRALGANQFVFGKLNSDNNYNNYVEIVGKGNSFTRSNARTLDWQGNETLAGDLTYNGNKSLTSEISRLDGKIDNLPAPMIFKGTLGVGGTIQTLPTASASNEGYTYKVITDGTYAGQTAKVGDVFTSNGSAWVYIPSGDEDNDTWRAIKVNGVEKLGNGISSGAVDFEDTTNVKFEFDANGNKISATLSGIYTSSEVNNLLDAKADKSDTYTKAQVDDIVYNILPDDTASGAVANFNTSLALPIKSLEVDVNAVQESGTPTPSSPKAISGWSAISLVQGGKNFGLLEQGTLNLYSGVEESSTNRVRTDFIPVKKGATYVASSQNNGWVLKNGVGYDANKNYVRYNINHNISTGIITIPDDISYIRFIYGNSNNTDCAPNDYWYQFEIGSTKSDYEPYVTPIAEVINLGGTYYGGHFTQDKAGHRQFEVTHNIVDLGTLDWTYFPNTNPPHFGAYIEGIKDRANNLTCSCFEVVKNNPYSNANLTIRSTNEHSLSGIKASDTDYTDKTSFANAVSGQKLVYDLAEPFTVELPDGQPINTLAGVNNFFADTGDSTVVFKSSVNDYVSAHSGGNLLGMGGVYLGGAKSGGGEEETDEVEDTEKTKEIDEPKEEIKTIGDMKKLGGE